MKPLCNRLNQALASPRKLCNLVLLYRDIIANAINRSAPVGGFSARLFKVLIIKYMKSGHFSWNTVMKSCLTMQSFKYLCTTCCCFLFRECCAAAVCLCSLQPKFNYEASCYFFLPAAFLGAEVFYFFHKCCLSLHRGQKWKEVVLLPIPWVCDEVKQASSVRLFRLCFTEHVWHPESTFLSQTPEKKQSETRGRKRKPDIQSESSQGDLFNFLM